MDAASGQTRHRIAAALCPEQNPASRPTVFCIHPANGDLFVNVSLTFAPDFLLLMDLRRNRLDGWLTRLQPAPTPNKYREKDRLRRHRRTCAAAFPAARKR